MITFYYLQVNIIGLIIMVILMANKNVSAGKNKVRRVFTLLVRLTAAELVLDSAIWLMRGAEFTGAYYVDNALCLAYYIIYCMIPFLWMYYTAVYFHVEYFLDGRLKIPVVLPYVVSAVCTAASFKTRWVFYVDESVYNYSGSMSWIMNAVSLIYLSAAAIVSFAMIKRFHTKAERLQCLSMLSFLVLPIAALIIQYLFYGTSTLWISVVLSLLMVFVNVQDNQISADSLTGLNNRYRFDKYLAKLAAENSPSDRYALLMIDVDRFKAINDTYGHIKGDRALVCVSEILKKSCHNTDAFVARYGGDEFAIICKYEKAPVMVERIESGVESFNAAKSEVFSLSLSIGITQFCGGGEEAAESFILRADQDMYSKKQAKKAVSQAV